MTDGDILSMRFFLNFTRKGTEKQQHNNIFMESARHVCLSVCRLVCENDKNPLWRSTKFWLKGLLQIFPRNVTLFLFSMIFCGFITFQGFWSHLTADQPTVDNGGVRGGGGGLCLWLWPLWLVTSDTWGDQLKYILLPNSFKHIIIAPNSSK